MISRRASGRCLTLTVLGLVTGAACSRADLAAITGPPAADAGAEHGMPVICPANVLAAGDSMQTLEVAGVTRSYLLHVPPAYSGSKPVPLLLDFHAIGSTGKQERMGSPYPAQTDAEGVVMAFPDGLGSPFGGSWNIGPCCVTNASNDDVAFADAVVRAISAVACIDPKRVYAAGVSMGGGMAYYLGCHAADVFAGIAPSAFDLIQEDIAGCQPARPLTVISFRGTGDTLVPYAGGYSSFVPGMPVTFLGAQATFRKWADLDHCTGNASAPDANGCSSYTSCDGAAEVVLCTKSGGNQAVGDASIAWPQLKDHPQP